MLELIDKSLCAGEVPRDNTKYFLIWRELVMDIMYASYGEKSNINIEDYRSLFEEFKYFCNDFIGLFCEELLEDYRFESNHISSEEKSKYLANMSYFLGIVSPKPMNSGDLFIKFLNDNWDNNIPKKVCSFGTVYLMHTNHGVKIGCTRNLAERVRTISRGLPFPILQVEDFLVPEYTRVESDLHRLFKNKRLNGEWFALDQTDIDTIHKRLKHLQHTGEVLFNE